MAQSYWERFRSFLSKLDQKNEWVKTHTKYLNPIYDMTVLPYKGITTVVKDVNAIRKGTTYTPPPEGLPLLEQTKWNRQQSEEAKQAQTGIKRTLGTIQYGLESYTPTQIGVNLANYIQKKRGLPSPTLSPEEIQMSTPAKIATSIGGGIASYMTVGSALSKLVNESPVLTGFTRLHPALSQIAHFTATAGTIDQLRQPIDTILSKRSEIFLKDLPSYLAMGYGFTSPLKSGIPTAMLGQYLSSKLKGKNNTEAFNDSLIAGAIIGVSHIPAIYNKIKLEKQLKQQAREVLRVSPKDSPEAIRKQYYLLSHQYDPTQHPEMVDKFKAVNQAYKILTTPNFQVNVRDAWKELKDIYKELSNNKSFALSIIRNPSFGLSIKEVTPQYIHPKDISPAKLEQLGIKEVPLVSPTYQALRSLSLKGTPNKNGEVLENIVKGANTYIVRINSPKQGTIGKVLTEKQAQDLLKTFANIKVGKEPVVDVQRVIDNDKQIQFLLSVNERLAHKIDSLPTTSDGTPLDNAKYTSLLKEIEKTGKQIAKRRDEIISTLMEGTTENVTVPVRNIAPVSNIPTTPVSKVVPTTLPTTSLSGVSAISKEVEPLAREARKYKSAEEFVKVTRATSDRKINELELQRLKSFQSKDYKRAENIEALIQDYLRRKYEPLIQKITKDDVGNCVATCVSRDPSPELFKAIDLMEVRPRKARVLLNQIKKIDPRLGFDDNYLYMNDRYLIAAESGIERLYPIIRAKALLPKGIKVYSKQQLTDFYNQAVKGVKEPTPEMPQNAQNAPQKPVLSKEGINIPPTEEKPVLPPKFVKNEELPKNQAGKPLSKHLPKGEISLKTENEKEVVSIPSKEKVTPKQIKYAHILARENGYVNKKGETNTQYKDLAFATTGKRSIKEMTKEEANNFITVLRNQSWIVAGHSGKEFLDSNTKEMIKDISGETPEKLEDIPSEISTEINDFCEGQEITPQELVKSYVEAKKYIGDNAGKWIKEAEKIAKDTTVYKNINLLDEARPSWRVLKKIGLNNLAKLLNKRVAVYSRLLKKDTKEFNKLIKTAKKNGVSAQRLSDLAERIGEEPTPKEQEVLDIFRDILKRKAGELKIPAESLIEDYLPHIFENLAIQEMNDRGLTRDAIEMSKYVSPSKINDKFLKQRLGKEGYIKDAFKALKTYLKWADRKIAYDPLLEEINKTVPSLPPESAKYLVGLGDTISGRPSDIDQLLHNLNEDIKNTEIGKTFNIDIEKLTNEGIGWLYAMWLSGPRSAIKNSFQPLLSLAYTHNSKAFTWALSRFTSPSIRKFVADNSDILAGRIVSYLPDFDESIIKSAPQKVRSGLLFLFRMADKNNVIISWLTGYKDALLLGFPEEVAMARGDEVAEKTQYIYTPAHRSAIERTKVGKIAAMFTSWPINYGEFVADLVKGGKSDVYADWVSKHPDTATPEQIRASLPSYKGLWTLIFMAIVAGYIKKHSRINALAYVGFNSLNNLLNYQGGGFSTIISAFKVATDLLVGDIDTAKKSFRELSPDKQVQLIRTLKDLGMFGDKPDVIKALFSTNKEEKPKVNRGSSGTFAPSPSIGGQEEFIPDLDNIGGVPNLNMESNSGEFIPDLDRL